MAYRSATPSQAVYPKCKAGCILSLQGADLLSTNNYPLNILKLRVFMKNQQYAIYLYRAPLMPNDFILRPFSFFFSFWCLECESIPVYTISRCGLQPEPPPPQPDFYGPVDEDFGDAAPIGPVDHILAGNLDGPLPPPVNQPEAFRPGNSVFVC